MRVLHWGLSKIKTHHLLDLYLLERTEPTRTRLHVQRTMDAVLLAFKLVLTIHDGIEGFGGYILEGF